MKTITFILCSMLLACNAFATIWTVSNDPNQPAQFGDIASAMSPNNPSFAPSHKPCSDEKAQIQDAVKEERGPF